MHMNKINSKYFLFLKETLMLSYTLDSDLCFVIWEINILVAASVFRFFQYKSILRETEILLGFIEIRFYFYHY